MWHRDGHNLYVHGLLLGLRLWGVEHKQKQKNGPKMQQQR